jgi:hypothetical protein
MLDASTCCCGIFAIVVNNSNAAKDDNFKILLNGTDIGHIDNSTDQALTGRIFADSEHVADFPPDKIATPNPNVFESTVALDLTLLIDGMNTLRVESIQDNNNGNFGAVRIGRWTLDASDKYELTAGDNTLLNTNYSFADGVGNGQNFTFNYSP